MVATFSYGEHEAEGEVIYNTDDLFQARDYLRALVSFARDDVTCDALYIINSHIS